MLCCPRSTCSNICLLQNQLYPVKICNSISCLVAKNDKHHQCLDSKTDKRQRWFQQCMILVAKTDKRHLITLECLL